MLNKALNGTITPVCFVLMNSFVYTGYYKLAIFFSAGAFSFNSIRAF